MLLFAVLLLASGACAVDWNVTTPLDEYVHSDDGYFEYDVIEEYDEGDHMLYVLNMTSQMWQNETLTTAPVWWHYLAIFVPTDASPPTPGEGRMARMAEFTRRVGVVSALLMMIPNQPIIFVDDPVIRIEDSIIGYTWKILVEDEGEDEDLDRSLNLLFPMTKAAKRALDTVEEFVPTVSDLAPTQFMATGYSKRGWTTWLLGATDQRVFAMAPTVFDLLGMYENLHHHHRSFGGWSWAFLPYWNEDVARYLNHPRFQLLAEDVDAINYNERLTMPKMLILAGNDQFFPSSGSHYFFDELAEPKFMCMWENDDHSLGDHQDEIDRNLEAFFTAARTGFDFPEVKWERTNDEEGGTLVLTGDEPLSVVGWMLDTTNKTCEEERDACRRDTRFRALNGLTDNEFDLYDVEDLDGSYRLHFPTRDEDGYRVFFMDMTYPGPEDLELRFTTEVNFVQDDFPFPRCETEEECHGILV
ncbi:hypothetical protein CAPTEDRAFT_221748 [Capitella teleta]|uniref:PhoPQ-activated pathogenicity-related protein n=1 Tax=Capitella teleta TaxID=283909 RepID=R7U4E9_CAPTE|nr:hypothetical protein CAPTEDRAFT_221748 [Capitella teleta]|eukprot:ELU00839.1 hypothetical protein CAPTEDRAFT_221748 [Capitella teleta]